MAHDGVVFGDAVAAEDQICDRLNALIDALSLTEGKPMSRRVDAHVARTQFGQLMDRAVRDKERFIVERRGEPTVVIMGVEDFLENALDAPDWLRQAWVDSKAAGMDKMTMDEINEEIAAHRSEKRAAGR